MVEMTKVEVRTRSKHRTTHAQGLYYSLTCPPKRSPVMMLDWK